MLDPPPPAPVGVERVASHGSPRDCRPPPPSDWGTVGGSNTTPKQWRRTQSGLCGQGQAPGAGGSLAEAEPGMYWKGGWGWGGQGCIGRERGGGGGSGTPKKVYQKWPEDFLFFPLRSTWSGGGGGYGCHTFCQAYVHLYSLCQTRLTLKTHTVSETENRTSCLTTLVRQSQSVAVSQTSAISVGSRTVHYRHRVRGGGGGGLTPSPSGVRAKGADTLGGGGLNFLPQEAPMERGGGLTAPNIGGGGGGARARHGVEERGWGAYRRPSDFE